MNFSFFSQFLSFSVSVVFIISRNRIWNLAQFFSPRDLFSLNSVCVIHSTLSGVGESGGLGRCTENTSSSHFREIDWLALASSFSFFGNSMESVKSFSLRNLGVLSTKFLFIIEIKRSEVIFGALSTARKHNGGRKCGVVEWSSKTWRFFDTPHRNYAPPSSWFLVTHTQIGRCWYFCEKQISWKKVFFFVKSKIRVTNVLEPFQSLIGSFLSKAETMKYPRWCHFIGGLCLTVEK